MARVAIYARVSTDQQTVDNQVCELQRWAERAGHTVGATYQDQGISGAKGRDKRPGLDAMLKGAVRREFDLVAAWSTDRLGRSLPDLLKTLEELRTSGRGLYLHTQALDTTTPAGNAMLQMSGVFAEFERSMIQARVNAGIARARLDGKKFGRPRRKNYEVEAVKAALLKGASVRDTVKATGASIGSVAAVRKELVEAGGLT